MPTTDFALSPPQREIMERLFGLGEHDPQSPEIVALYTGLTAENVERIARRIMWRRGLVATDQP